MEPLIELKGVVKEFRSVPPVRRSDYRDPAWFEESERCESLPDGGRYFQNPVPHTGI